MRFSIAVECWSLWITADGGGAVATARALEGKSVGGGVLPLASDHAVYGVLQQQYEAGAADGGSAGSGAGGKSLLARVHAAGDAGVCDVAAWKCSVHCLFGGGRRGTRGMSGYD